MSNPFLNNPDTPVEDLEHNKFKDVLGKGVVVKVSLEEDNSGSSGFVETNFFQDFYDVVVGDTPATIFDYEVPVSTILFLSQLLISCRLEAEIIVKLNSTVIGSLRTGAAKPVAKFSWDPNRECVAGDVVQVILTKRAGTPDISVGAHLMGLTQT